MLASVKTSAKGSPSLREAGAEPIQARHGSASAIRGGTIAMNSVGSIRRVIIPYITMPYGSMFTLRFKASAIRVSDRRRQGACV